MKNSLFKYLLCLFILTQGSTSICQTALDDLQLRLRIGPSPSPIPVIYIPGQNNFLSIRKKSDLKISFNRTIGWNRSTNSGRFGSISNFTLGYSPIPHLYGTANFLTTNERTSFGTYNSKVVLGDIGIGGYFVKEMFSRKPHNPNWLNHGLLVNALVGYSRGKISHEGLIRFGFARFITNQFYGKIGVNYQRKFWGVASNFRFGVINYGTTILLGHGYSDLIPQRELLADENDFLFGEVSLRAYVGIKYAQIYMNIGMTKVNSTFNRFILSDTMSLGVVLDIQETFKKKSKDEK